MELRWILIKILSLKKARISSQPCPHFLCHHFSPCYQKCWAASGYTNKLLLSIWVWSLANSIVFKPVVYFPKHLGPHHLGPVPYATSPPQSGHEYILKEEILPPSMSLFELWNGHHYRFKCSRISYVLWNYLTVGVAEDLSSTQVVVGISWALFYRLLMLIHCVFSKKAAVSVK